MLVSAIVVNLNRDELLDRCLASLRVALAALDSRTELIVVDNGSNDRSCALVRDRYPDAELVLLGRNRGFAAAASEGIRRSLGRWILLLNNDATIAPDGAAEMLGVADGHAAVGCVAAQMRFVSEPPLINSAGIEVDRLGVAYDRLLGAAPSASETTPTEVFGASGGAALYSRAMLDDIGGFDESFFVFMEDADVAWRARMRGWRALYAPGAVVMHHHSATAGHGSGFKHFQVGLNRVRLLAKNADTSLLRRYGAAMLAYDIAYVVYACAAHRTLAPLRGRVQGVREWRVYRRVGESRRPVELAPIRGWRSALGRHAVWKRRSAHS